MATIREIVSSAACAAIAELHLRPAAIELISTAPRTSTPYGTVFGDRLHLPEGLVCTAGYTRPMRAQVKALGAPGLDIWDSVSKSAGQAVPTAYLTLAIICQDAIVVHDGEAVAIAQRIVTEAVAAKLAPTSAARQMLVTFLAEMVVGGAMNSEALPDDLTAEVTSEAKAISDVREAAEQERRERAAALLAQWDAEAQAREQRRSDFLLQHALDPENPSDFERIVIGCIDPAETTADWFNLAVDALASNAATGGRIWAGYEAEGAMDYQLLCRAIRAYQRHTMTNYDDLLAQGVDRDLARDEIACQMPR